MPINHLTRSNSKIQLFFNIKVDILYNKLKRQKISTERELFSFIKDVFGDRILVFGYWSFKRRKRDFFFFLVKRKRVSYLMDWNNLL